jgi:hypothetical protein
MPADTDIKPSAGQGKTFSWTLEINNKTLLFTFIGIAAFYMAYKSSGKQSK